MALPSPAGTRPRRRQHDYKMRRTMADHDALSPVGHLPRE